MSARVKQPLLPHHQDPTGVLESTTSYMPMYHTHIAADIAPQQPEEPSKLRAAQVPSLKHAVGAGWGPALQDRSYLQGLSAASPSQHFTGE